MAGFARDNRDADWTGDPGEREAIARIQDALEVTVACLYAVEDVGHPYPGGGQFP